jgi:pimeloyl-ACP methyl ester carboxylesterase
MTWTLRSALFVCLVFGATLLGSNEALAQGACTIQFPKSLSFDQWKAEVQTRADRGIYPLIGLPAAEVREGLRAATRPDCDEWAEIWIGIGDRYLTKAKAELATDRAAADADFLMAWRWFNFARWPTLLSDGKRRAWDKAQEAFAGHGALMDPPTRTVRVPFPGNSDIVGILRTPKAAGPAPLLITIGGLDGWRDDMTVRFAALPENGFAVFAMDAPGTGDSPVNGTSSNADSMFSRLIDWAREQPAFDPARIFVHGGSFGGYWSARVAITEAGRLRGVIDQSGPTDAAFDTRALDQPEPLLPSFYLSDTVPSISRMLGTSTRVETDAAWTGMSLRRQGLIGKPTAPMLVVGGARDPLVPTADLWLVLSNGDTPKEAWIHPRGLHMGREPGVWRDEELLMKVMLPWLKRQAGMVDARKP